MYACIYIYVHIYINVYTYVVISIYTHCAISYCGHTGYASICTCKCKCLCMYICTENAYLCIHMLIHLFAFTYTYVYSYIREFLCISMIGRFVHGSYNATSPTLRQSFQLPCRRNLRICREHIGPTMLGPLGA